MDLLNQLDQLNAKDGISDISTKFMNLTGKVGSFAVKVVAKKL